MLKEGVRAVERRGARTFNGGRGVILQLLLAGQTAWLVPREGADGGAGKAGTSLVDLKGRSCPRPRSSFLRHLVGSFCHLSSQFRALF
jgi:hypothetical protein